MCLIGYEATLLSSKNIAKALICLLHNIRNNFYKAAKNSNFVDDSINLIALKCWLDSRVQNYFKPLTSIVASHEKQKTNNERNNKLIVNLTKMDSHINENLSDNVSLRCWFCKNNHRLMDYPSFKNRSISERREFVKENKICFNYLSKTHINKDCKASFICREQNCDKNHHTLLHEPPNVNVNNNLINDLCTENEYLQREVSHLENVENLSRPELNCKNQSKLIFHIQWFSPR